MNIFGIESRGLNVAERMLDMTSKSTEVVAMNIANSETPSYKARSLNFQERVQMAMKASVHPNVAAGGIAITDPRHLPVRDLNAIEPEVKIELSGGSINGNTVNMEQEITKLKELDLKYSLYSNVTTLELSRLKSAIALR